MWPPRLQHCSEPRSVGWQSYRQRVKVDEHIWLSRSRHVMCHTLSHDVHLAMKGFSSWKNTHTHMPTHPYTCTHTHTHTHTHAHTHGQTCILCYMLVQHSHQGVFKVGFWLHQGDILPAVRIWAPIAPTNYPRL